METTNLSRSWLCSSARSCESDPLIISVVFRAYQLCISRHASVPSFTHVHVLVGLHPVIIRTLVLFLGTHRIKRTCCTCGLFCRELRVIRKLHHCRASTGIDCRFRAFVIDRIANWLFESRESVELCCSTTILPGRNNVPMSARRSLQYSFSNCIS